MKRLVIDIETVGTPWEEHDPYVREYLIKGMNEAEAEEEKRRGALSPFLGRVVTIGIINVDTGRSCALFEVPGQEELITRKDGDRTFISGSEKLILRKFWDYLGRDDWFITFNGRQFDGPFLMIRSAINGLAPKRDLVGYRYSFSPNCDLREVLSFCGTINTRQIRFNLDLACRTFGIASSKREGRDGRSVESMYRAGEYEEIADYCLEDVRATGELYEKLASTILRLSSHQPVSRDVAPMMEDAATVQAGSFSEHLQATSLTFSTSLDILSEGSIVSEKQGVVILEKLLRPEAAEDSTEL